MRGFSVWLLIFYRQELWKMIFANLKLVIFDLCILDSGIRYPASGFLVLGLPESDNRSENSDFLL